jgi:hypothetical protein
MPTAATDDAGMRSMGTMTHTLLLVFVAICWAGVAIDAAVHLLMGDLVLPMGMLGAFILWSTLWRMHFADRRDQVPAKA